MKNRTAHEATVTLKLPSSVQGRALVEALRRGGIPVDALGSVASGYLFVRTTGRFGKRSNTFRWFAADGSEDPVASFASPTAEEKVENQSTAASTPALIPPPAPQRLPTPVSYLRVWKELEQRARRAEAELHAKRIAYFRGLGPAPDTVDRELVKRAWAIATQCLAAANDETSYRDPDGEPLVDFIGMPAGGVPEP
ncbi:hypothetical protein ABID97_005750 [Variovorax sp. OAS795]|uniref:hypothetical protein n=1 Tax=Variovorax sp. OAS795 TaxID=3034231 RepID=UPI0033963B08